MMKLMLLAGALALSACGQNTKPEVEILDAWARATADGQKSGAVYLTIENKGAADRLVAAATDSAGMAMIHEVDNEGGISRMRMVQALDVPAESAITLRPGGTHIMLESMNAPLITGDRFALRLRFAISGEKTATVNVVEPGSR